jgi:hypothetical protein
MRDFDERFSALPDGPAVKVGNSVFRYDVMHGASRGNHPGSRIKHGDDAGDLAAFAVAGIAVLVTFEPPTVTFDTGLRANCAIFRQKLAARSRAELLTRVYC